MLSAGADGIRMLTDNHPAQVRRDAYDRAVEALLLVNPKAVPIAKLEDACSIARVSNQVRETAPPKPADPHPEAMLISRVSNMANACSQLVARAKRLGIAVELRIADRNEDPGKQLQTLISFHDQLEKQVAYWQATTKEQRAIDDLQVRLRRTEKQLGAMATAMASLSDLLPHLLRKAGR